MVEDGRGTRHLMFCLIGKNEDVRAETKKGTLHVLNDRRQALLYDRLPEVSPINGGEMACGIFPAMSVMC